MAATVAGWAAPLARFPAGARASFLYTPHPQAVALDLAVQAAGLVAVPLAEGQQGRVDIAGEAVALPSWEEAERAGAPEPERLTRGGVVADGSEVSAEELAAAAERLEIPAVGARDILVLGGFAGSWPERLLLSWGTVTGAALLFEPHAPSFVQTAVWARATVFAGTAADLVLLRAAVERDEAGFRVFGRKRRQPLGRLRAVAVTTGDLPAEERPFWSERGVLVTSVQGFAAERQERGI
ncbi:MAG TPA: hypothetical protein VJ885_02115 [Thermoanaerobaculia bacterium]|nr:hypothetical protein [Thermoanaerobaculia bacterium]